MPVILSDETWARIEKMLDDHDNNKHAPIILGEGLKWESEGAEGVPWKLGIDGINCP